MSTFLNERNAPRKPSLHCSAIRANEGAMRRAAFFSLILVLLPAAALAAPRTALGIFEDWGAFREARTPRCFAIAEPSASIGRAQEKPYASIGYWPRSRIRGQFYIRLSKPRLDGSELRLTVGSRRFILAGNGAHGWASDARMDAAIIAAMRSAQTMRVESRAASGGAISDRYRLRGAATAIDAAALGCAKLR
jgi:hypothetical protein